MYQDGEHWVGVCLEHYTLAMGDTLSDLVEQLRKAIEASLAISSERGVAPLEGIPRSPKRYWDLDEEACPADKLWPAASPSTLPRIKLLTAEVPAMFSLRDLIEDVRGDTEPDTASLQVLQRGGDSSSPRVPP